MTFPRLLAAALLCAACSGPARESRPQPRPAPRAAPPPLQAAGPDGAIRVALTHDEFHRLLNALDQEAGDKAKLAMLETAARHSWFSTAQAGALIDHVVYRENKLLAVPLVKDRILDQQNEYLLYQHFTYREDKARVQEMLER